MKANYPKRGPEPVYVKRIKNKGKKSKDAKSKLDNKKNQKRISRKGIQ